MNQALAIAALLAYAGAIRLKSTDGVDPEMLSKMPAE